MTDEEEALKGLSDRGHFSRYSWSANPSTFQEVLRKLYPELKSPQKIPIELWERYRDAYRSAHFVYYSVTELGPGNMATFEGLVEVALSQLKEEHND